MQEIEDLMVEEPRVVRFNNYWKMRSLSKICVESQYQMIDPVLSAVLAGAKLHYFVKPLYK